MSIHTLVHDIYHMLETKDFPEGVSVDEECERFGQEMAALLKEQLQKEEDRAGRLRLSSIGKPDRQIYNAYKGVSGEKLKGPDYIKFLYGHIIEALVLSLVRLAGHSVTDQQKEVEVEGVKGHIDCYIDGRLVDVKSCSTYSYKKFRDNKLHEDDPFGYLAQLKSYAYAEGQELYAWLAMDKQNGHLCVLEYDERDKHSDYYDAINWCPSVRVRRVKKLVSGESLPPLCYPDIEDGKSGNRRLDTGCAFCAFKHACWPGLQTYAYANGVKHLTHVDRTPRVVKIPEDF